MFDFLKGKKISSDDEVDFDPEKFKVSLMKKGLNEGVASSIVADISESIRDKVVEKTTQSYETFMNAVSTNVEGLSVLPTERIEACRELGTFLSENPEVNNSIRLYASYIAYGAAETKLEEYRLTILGDDAEKIKEAHKFIKKWDKRSRIKRTIFQLAKDLIPFGDAFLEKLYVVMPDGSKKLSGVAYIPANTMYPKVNNKGYPTKYYQIIDSKGDKFADADALAVSSLISDGVVVEFESSEIIHFSDGSAIGVTDTPYYNLIILWRYLKMLEESLVIHKMTRARRFIVFLLDVTGKDRNEIRTAVSNFTQNVKSIFKMNVKSGSITSTKSTVPSSSDLVIPVTKDSATKVTNIPSDQSATKVDDLSFYLNRITTNMFTSHVFNHSNQTGNEKYIEKSFMRLVKIYQRQMEYELEDLYNELLVGNGFLDLDVKIQFPSPDAEQEIRIVDSIVRRMMIVNQLTATIGVVPPVQWIVDYVFKDLAQYEIDELIIMLKKALEEQEQEQQGDEYPDIFKENKGITSDGSVKNNNIPQNTGTSSLDKLSNDFSLRDQSDKSKQRVTTSESIHDIFDFPVSNKDKRVVEKTKNASDKMEASIKLALQYMEMVKNK
jgi:hypothetical protein